MDVRPAFHIPAAKTTEDATKLGKETEETKGSKYWEDKERESRAKLQYEESERAAREGRAREQNPPEPPFQVKGSFNLGDFDLQKNNADLQSTIASIQKDSREREDKLHTANEASRDKIAEIRTQMIEQTMKASLESVQRELRAKGGETNESTLAKFNEIISLAGMLGYSKPDPAAAAEQMPATIQLQILKMEMEEKGRVRQFEWDKIESERNWQIALKRLELEAAGKRDELSLEREKRASFISPFETIGSAIAKGLADMGTEAPDKAAVSPRVKSKAKPKVGNTYQMQAGMTDSGTVACPECREPIAIAPKAKSAFCPSCEATIDNERMEDDLSSGKLV